MGARRAGCCWTQVGVLCCAVLCCAVLCCAVLCCAVLCCAVLCCAVCMHVCMHAIISVFYVCEMRHWMLLDTGGVLCCVRISWYSICMHVGTGANTPPHVC
jgi:hypothetical protein